MAAILTPKTYGGHNISDGTTYRARFLASSPIGHSVAAKLNTVQIPGSHPKTTGADYDGKSLQLQIQVIDATSKTNREQLYKWFASSVGEVYLIATDESSVDRRIAVRCQQLIPVEGTRNLFMAILWADDGHWLKDTETSDTQHCVSVDLKEWTLTNNGTAPAKPKFKFQLNAAKEQAHSYLYQRYPNFVTNCKYPISDPDAGGSPFCIYTGWNTAALVTAGKMLASGDDCRVFVDGIEVNRWAGTGTAAFNQTATNLWINAAWLARTKGTLATAIASGDPDGTPIVIAEGTADFPDSGFVALRFSPVTSEVWYYNGKTDTSLLNTQRAQWGTTAKAFSVGYAVIRAHHEIRILYGRTDAGTPPADADFKPMIDLANSTNYLRKWPDDYLEEDTHRSAQWQRDDLPLNELSPKLRGYEASSKMYVEDSPPEAGKPQRNVWYLNVPQGITGAASIHHDVAVPANMILQVWGNDGAAPVLLAEYTPNTHGDDLNITPAAPVYSVEYRAMVRTVTGFTATGDAADAEFSIGAGDHQVYWQNFTLAQATQIAGFIVRLKKAAGATGTIKIDIRPKQVGADSQPLTPSLTIDVATGLTTAYANYPLFFTTPLVFAAGTYSLCVKGYGIATASVYWSEIAAHAFLEDVWMWHAAAYAWQDAALWFEILGDGSVCQPEAPSGSGEECTIDDIELILSSTDSILQVAAGAEAACYYLCGPLENLTTGQMLTFAIPSTVTHEIYVDTEAKTITDLTTGIAYPLLVVATDGVNWMDLLPGANAMRWTEPGMVHTDIVSTFRDTYEQ